MRNASRNAARGRVQQEEEIPFEKVDAVRVLKDIVGSYLNPLPFAPGDIVQTRNHFAHWEGAEASDPAPLMVVAACADLSEVTDDLGLKGVPGIRIAKVEADQGVMLIWKEAWHFEAYDGPIPDAH